MTEGGEILELKKTRFDKFKSVVLENRLLKNLLIVLGCFVGGFLILSPFIFSPYMNLGDDLQYHFTVLKAFDEAFANGQFFNKILPLICNDFGYGTGNFYGTLPSMLTVIVKNTLNCSIWSAVKVSVYLVFSSSILIMYAFSYRVFKKHSWAGLSTVIFATFPYYLSDLYVRFAYSEFFLFIGMVAVFWGMFELLYRNNKRGFFALFTIGLSWCMLTHLALSVWICLVCLVFMIVRFRQFMADFNWLVFLVSCVVVLCLTAYFTIPLVEYYMGDTLYRVFDSAVMQTSATWLYGCTSWLPFFYTPGCNVWGLVRVCFPLYNYLIIIGAIVYLIKSNKKKSTFLENPKPKNKSQKTGVFTMVALIMIFILSMSKFSLWYITPSVFRMIQFPFRLLMLTAPFFALLAPFAVKAVNKNRKKVAIISIAVVSTFAVCFGIFLSSLTVFRFSRESSDNISTGFGCGWQHEYLPSESDIDYVKNRNNTLLHNPNGLDIRDVLDYRSKQRLQMYFLNGYGMVDDGYGEPDYTKTDVVLKIPYSENLRVTQKSASFTNGVMQDYSYSNFDDKWSAELEFVPFEIDGETYIKFELEREISLVFVDYSEAPQTAVWLDENPYQFVVESGDVDFSNMQKDGINYTVDVTVLSESTIELPSIYYKGYKVELTTADGVKEIKPSLSENGFLQVAISESGTLAVRWEGSAFVQVGKIVALIGVGLFLFVLALAFLIPKKVWIKSKKKVTDFCASHSTIMEIFRFLIIGAIATVVDWVFMAIVMFKMEPTIYDGFLQVIVGGTANPSTASTVLGTGVGALVGMVVSYIFSVLFVFKEKGNSKSAFGFAMFIFLSLIGLGLHMLGMYVGYNLLHINEWFVKIVMSIIVLVYNYVSKRIVIFNNARKSNKNKKILLEKSE